MNIDFKNKRTIALLVTTGTLLVLTSAILAFIFLIPEKKIEIPDFLNKTKLEVETWMFDNDLTEERVTLTYEYNETVEKDIVVSQSIVAGEKLKKDELLSITLSNGFDPELVVTLPDFTGMTYENINQWFIDNKFSDVTYEYIPDEKIQKDIFIKSNLATNEAHRNEVIVISISVGTESVGVDITMPDFADYTKANIQAWGKTNNMAITFKNEASDKVAANKVISQSPKAGEATKTGEKVTVTISTGKGITAIKFDGKTKKDVDAWAKTNSIKITYVDAYDSKVASGTVITNKPNSGTIAANSTMTVTVSIGKPSIDNYTNKSIASFQTYIDGLNKNSANLKLTITEVQSTSTPGTILKQTINGNVVSAATTVDTGTTIVVEVAKTKSTTVENKAGTTEANFKTYVTGLGLVVGTKTERYSSTVASGLIISNDTGAKAAGATINYVLSKGAYSPTAASFDGKTEAEGNSLISSAVNQGAGNWTITYYQYLYNDTIASGKTYGCSIKGTSVACYVSLGPNTSRTVESKINTDEASFRTYITNLGLVPVKTGSDYSSTVAAGNILWNQTGPFTVGNQVKYTISDGVKPVATATVPSYSLQILSGGSYAISQQNVRSSFSSFTNLKFVEVVDNDPSISDGHIKSISEQPGAVIPVDKQITIEIVKR